MTVRVSIVGAGIGGLTVALALRKLGVEVEIFEQTARMGRVGADINLTPNAFGALAGLGDTIGAQLREYGATPRFRISRLGSTGEETSRIEMGQSAELRYGAPQLTIHRADLMSVLLAELPSEVITMGSRVTSVEFGSGPVLTFADGTRRECDVLVGADGIHSRVRTSMFGEEQPDFTGVVAMRSVVAADRVAHVPNLDSFTKWWGPDPETQIVTFPLSGGSEVFVFATVAQPDWTEESWTTRGEVADLTTPYAHFHPEAVAILHECDEVMKSALYVRDPLPTWTNGQATLLGDACHPMMPFMAQGAGQAIEDSIVLARALSTIDDPEVAMRAYEQARLPRTARIQHASRNNEWLKTSGTGDWVYEYDAWAAPIPSGEPVLP